MSELALDDPECPAWSPFFGFAGIAIGVVLACAGRMGDGLFDWACGGCRAGQNSERLP